MPVADYQFNTDKFCLQGNNFQFNQSSTNPGGLSMNHRWYYGNGDSLINSTTGQVSYLTPGTYNVSLVSSTNLGNCRDTSIKSFVVHPMPEGVKAECPTQTEIILKGSDKQVVGQVAAEIRAYRPPEPYKGKGVRYVDEHVIIKETKKK
jgi:hypothetical protein